MTSSPLPSDIATPAYVIDVARLKANMAAPTRIRREAGAKVLLATKAFAMPAAFPHLAPYLDGTTASGGLRQEFARILADRWQAREMRRLYVEIERARQLVFARGDGLKGRLGAVDCGRLDALAIRLEEGISENAVGVLVAVEHGDDGGVVLAGIDPGAILALRVCADCVDAAT